jgi:hypothetical protein
MIPSPPVRPAPSQPFFAIAVVIGVAWSVSMLLAVAILTSWVMAEKTDRAYWQMIAFMALVGMAYLLPLISYWKSVRAGAYRRKLAFGWKVVSVLTWTVLLLAPLGEATLAFGYYAGLLLPLGCWAYGIWLSTKA